MISILESRVSTNNVSQSWPTVLRFLADRTNGRAIATLLRLSVRRPSVVCDVMYCG